jgi:methyl-accepting chemotaxis protein
MFSDRPKRRWLRLFRRGGVRDMAGEPSLEEMALWSAHERALLRSRDTGAAAQRIASTAARHRASIEGLAERARSISTRVVELTVTATRVADSFERLGLVALNAGLEGARLGEADGRRLALVGDEVRGHSTRGGDAGRELAANLAQLAAELTQLEGQVGVAQTIVTEVAQDSARAAGAASDAEAALVDMGERVKAATGSDPEATRSVAEAAERARALGASLTALHGKVPLAMLFAALQPAIEPIERLLAGESGGADRSETSRG